MLTFTRQILFRKLPGLTSHYRNITHLTHWIDQVFTQLKQPGRSELIKSHLLQKIIKKDLLTAERNISEPSWLLNALEQMKDHGYTRDQVFTWLEKQALLYKERSVPTSHPTLSFTPEAMIRRNQCTAWLLQLKDPNTKPMHKQQIQEYLTHMFKTLIDEPFVSPNKLTRQQEVEFGLYILKCKLKTFALFLHQLAEKIQAVYGGDLETIIAKLKPIIMPSFQENLSWQPGDADGNPYTTASIMASMLALRQIAMIQLYLDQIHHILCLWNITAYPTLFEQLNSYAQYLERCIQAINKNIWFEIEGSKTRAKQLTQSLDTLLQGVHETPLDPPIRKEVTILRDLIELVTFCKGTTEFSRQSSKKYDKVFNKLINMLVPQFPELAGNLQSPYHIKTVISQFSKNPELFSTLKDHLKDIMVLRDVLSLKQPYSHLFPIQVIQHITQEVTEYLDVLDELERLAFIAKNNDDFPYAIISDTKSEMDAHKHRILSHLGLYLQGDLRIGQVKEFMHDILLLCETPEDLAKLRTTFKAFLLDPGMLKRIEQHKVLMIVIGDSDVRRCGGSLAGDCNMEAISTAHTVLQECQAIEPRLRGVRLEILHGGHTDRFRRSAHPKNLRFKTLQGDDAFHLIAAPHVFSNQLHRGFCFPGEIVFKVLERKQFFETYPEAAHAWLQLRESSIAAYMAYRNEPSTGLLLSALSNDELADLANRGSRPRSKEAVSNDPLAILNRRAIDLLFIYGCSGIYSNMFMSFAGVLEPPAQFEKYLPMIFNMTLVKDMVYEGFYAIAISNFPRAWRKLNQGIVPNENQITLLYQDYCKNRENKHPISLIQALAYLDVTTHRIIPRLLTFFPPEMQQKGFAYLNRHVSRVAPTTAHPEDPSLQALQDMGSMSIQLTSDQLALGVLEAMGGFSAEVAHDIREQRKDIQLFTQCIDHYLANPCRETADNAITIWRGLNIPAGIPALDRIVSPLFLNAVQQPNFTCLTHGDPWKTLGQPH